MAGQAALRPDPDAFPVGFVPDLQPSLHTLKTPKLKVRGKPKPTKADGLRIGGRLAPEVARQACSIVEFIRVSLISAGASVRRCRTLARHLNLSGQRKLDRPDGLQTGSPPSPSPQLIRPSVRLLLRSPRFWVRVPSSLTPPRLAALTSFRRSSETREIAPADIAQGNVPHGRW
jgi:hypothetical protein